MSTKENVLEYDCAGRHFRLENLAEGFECSISELAADPEGITDIEIKFTASSTTKPTAATLSWRVPMDSIHFKWNPACGLHRFLDVTSACANRFTSRGIDRAPVVSLYDISGTNTLTYALSDAMHEVEPSISVGEDALITCRMKFFCEPWDPISEYSAILRIDRRRVPYYVCLREVGMWWTDVGAPAPAPLPEAARLPVLSTWYSHHADIEQADIEKQCRLAKDLGMDVIILDAGWATGEIVPNTEKFPDFAGHIKTVQDMGMKYVLWTTGSSPNPVTADRFKDKVWTNPKTGNKRLDPRYPDVREYMIDMYERLMRDYDVDGFKIDFISSFGKAAEDEPDDDGRDIKSVSVAADRMLTDIYNKLKAIKPDVLIEYRQGYTGPHMLAHGNMIRAVDCGNCFADNRLRTIDIRLLSGSSVAQSDMVIWNSDEPVESAAMQLLHTIFSVPQISVKFDGIPSDHTEMIRYYVKFWREHRDVLLDGELMPLEPQAAFPVVLSATGDKLVAAVYGDSVVPLPESVPGALLLVNGTYTGRVVLEVPADAGEREVITRTCTGVEASRKKVALTRGVHAIEMPKSGYAELLLQ